jgi:hypothetical protein
MIWKPIKSPHYLSQIYWCLLMRSTINWTVKDIWWRLDDEYKQAYIYTKEETTIFNTNLIITYLIWNQIFN